MLVSWAAEIKGAGGTNRRAEQHMETAAPRQLCFDVCSMCNCHVRELTGKCCGRGEGMTQKMSFVSHRRQLSNGWSSRGGWRHQVQLGKPGKACPRRDSPEHRELVGGAQPLSHL